MDAIYLNNKPHVTLDTLAKNIHQELMKAADQQLFIRNLLDDLIFCQEHSPSVERNLIRAAAQSAGLKVKGDTRL